MLGILSIETRTGSANLGKITGILSDGTAVTTGQAITDAPPSLSAFSNLQSSIALQNGINSGLFTTHSGLISALTARVAALESAVATLQADMPTFKFNGGTAVPLKQLQARTGDFPGTAYYNQSGILMLSITTPPLNNPYEP